MYTDEISVDFCTWCLCDWFMLFCFTFTCLPNLLWFVKRFKIQRLLVKKEGKPIHDVISLISISTLKKNYITHLRYCRTATLMETLKCRVRWCCRWIANMRHLSGVPPLLCHSRSEMKRPNGKLRVLIFLWFSVWGGCKFASSQRKCKKALE